MGLSDFVKDMVIARKLHFEKGRFELLGLRGVILPTKTFGFMVEQLYEQLGEDMDQIMFETGKAHGKSAVNDVGRENAVSKRELLYDLSDSGSLMGLGKLETSKFRSESCLIEVLISDMALVDKLEASGKFDEPRKPVAEFFRGLYYSFGEEMFDEEIRCDVEYLDQKDRVRIRVTGDGA